MLLGKQSNAAGEDLAGEPTRRGLWQCMHSHQRQLQSIWQVPRDEVHAHGGCHGGQDIRVPAGEVQGHQTGYVRTVPIETGSRPLVTCLSSL